MKYLLIIGDGMADNPLNALGGLTALEKAQIPTMDALASMGEIGSVKTIPEGFVPGSDPAIMGILGCAPEKYFSGRAPLEAAAQGIRLTPGDCAFRCNNVALSEGGNFEDKLILSHSAGAIHGEDGQELVTWLFEQPSFKTLAEEAGVSIYPTCSYRHICVQEKTDISGIKLSPPHDHLGETVGENLPTGCSNAPVLTELLKKANELLESHPINIKRRKEGNLTGNGIWFWAEGTAASLPNFTKLFGKTGAMVSAVALCHGLAALIGLDKIEVPGATGELDTNYEGKLNAAVKALESHDFACIHLEAPDECSHGKDVEGKIQAIEWLDSRIAAPSLEKLKERGEDFRILILSDHKTFLENGQHGAEPVPYIIYDSRYNRNNGAKYTEREGERGAFIENGAELMPILFEL